MKNIILICSILSGQAFAGNLQAPAAFPSAKVLPKGVRNFNLKGVIASGSTTYNNSGTDVVLADPFFNNLTYKNMLDGIKDPYDRASAKAKLDQIGASEDDSFGNTTGQVNAKITATVPVFAWGFTPKFTGAIVVPVIRSSINVDTGVNHTNEAMYNAMVDALADVSSKQDEFEDKLASPVSTKLADYNYEPLESQTETKLGDIKLVAKYKTWEDRKNTLTLGGEVSLPTGKEANPNKVVDTAGGDGQTDFGVAVNHDWFLSKGLTLSTTLSHIVQLKDTTEKRVPFTSSSSLTPDTDTEVSRDLGDISLAQTALKWKGRDFSAGLGYAIQYKQGDKYAGTKYEESRYNLIGKNSVQNMQTVMFNFGYDTIGLYQRGKFAAPLAVGITHSRVLSGKNVVNDPLTVLDFSLFF
jgi:hypothetical protein